MLKGFFSCFVRGGRCGVVGNGPLASPRRELSSAPPFATKRIKQKKFGEAKKKGQRERVIKKQSQKVHRVYQRLLVPFFNTHFPEQPFLDKFEDPHPVPDKFENSQPVPDKFENAGVLDHTTAIDSNEKNPKHETKRVLTPEHQEKVALSLFYSGNCQFREAVGPKKFSEMSSNTIGEEQFQEREEERRRLIQRGERVEIAFAGRSNVGKSSLLNALFGTKENFARTSKTPGRTQTLNFFNVGKLVTLVDMPGYGYASAPTSLVGEWHKMVAQFLLTRLRLCHTFLLIDSRRGLGYPDRNLLESLGQMKISHQIVLTKIDRISFPEAFKLLNQLNVEARVRGGSMKFPVLATSSKHQFGVFPLQYEIMGKMREYGAFE